MIRIQQTQSVLPFSTTMPGPEKAAISPGGPFSISAANGLSPLHSAVATYAASRGDGEGRFATPMSGVHIMRAFKEKLPLGQMYRPSLCVVIQGAKQMMFGEETLNYGEMECLIVSVDLPASGRVTQASPTRPFLGVNIELDTAMLRDVLQQLPKPPARSETTTLGAFVGKVDGDLADSVLRLIRLADTPEAIPVLYPSILREICYRLLVGSNGGEVCKLALPETHAERVSRAIYILRHDFAQPLRVEQLAETAGMSLSSFHQHFKSLTSMTPIQYQKQLRLLEARRLMVAEAANVGKAAFQVGYQSASQFSREYSRMFGMGPKRDAINCKTLLANSTH